MPITNIDSRFYLHHGTLLPTCQVGYQLVGPKGAPVVVVLGGISASCGVVEWWGTQIGPDKAIDTNRVRVLSFDFLGGNGHTTGARSGKCPDISTFDQAEVLKNLLDDLGIWSIASFIGASYGGMVGLAFAQLFPERLQHLAVISAAHRSATLGTAWRIVQRRIVELGAVAGRKEEGLALARALAMTTYRTPDDLAERFAGNRRPGGHADDFPVWNYLDARGNAYVQHMDPDAFVTLSRSIDLHAVDAAAIKTPLDLVSVNQDLLVPPALIEELAACYGGPCRLHKLDSRYGHDAFLKENDFFAKFFCQIQGDRGL